MITAYQADSQRRGACLASDHGGQLLPDAEPDLVRLMPVQAAVRLMARVMN